MLERACRRAVDWVAPGDNPSGVIYGVIVIGALLAAESASHESYLDTVGSALIATCLYWFAHAYASLLGRRLTTQERLTAGGLWGSLSHDWALVRGATIPLLALVCGWLAGASQQTSVTAALWTCVAWLIALELVAGLRSLADGRPGPDRRVLRPAHGRAGPPATGAAEPAQAIRRNLRAHIRVGWTGCLDGKRPNRSIKFGLRDLCHLPDHRLHG